MRRLCEPCGQEFQLRNCGFGNALPDELVRSQWQSRTKNVGYLIYRWLVAIFYVATVAISMSHIATWRSFGLYLIYLTDWGILLCMFTGLFGALLVSTWYFHPQYCDNVCATTEMPAVFKWYWAMHNATMTLSFVITIIYWGILHNSSIPLSATNVLTHACNSAIMLLDVLIVAHPIRLYHVYQPLTVGLLFLIFSGIYYAAGGTDLFGNPYIYFVLDWSKPDNALITAVGTVLLAFVVHTALFAVQKLRVFVHNRWARKRLSAVEPGKTADGSSSSTGSSSSSPTTHVSMVLGTGYNNAGFKGSSSQIV